MDARGFAKRTPLLAMCFENDAVSAELVGALVALGANVRATDKDGNSALWLLCCNSAATPALLQLLVREHGLDVDARGFNKLTPLLAMCIQNGAVSAELLGALLALSQDLTAGRSPAALRAPILARSAARCATDLKTR